MINSYHLVNKFTVPGSEVSILQLEKTYGRSKEAKEFISTVTKGTFGMMFFFQMIPL